MENKHPNYEILNMIGYGLAKFGISFINHLGFHSKKSFYDYIIKSEIANSIGTVKNRQDLFDPFFDNGRKGWWQKGNTYIHRKILIDNLFGGLDSKEYSDVLKLYLVENSKVPANHDYKISPIVKSKFKQLQLTGQEAEIYFIENYHKLPQFKEGVIEDARLFGDGYDFQIKVNSEYFLAEVKGVREPSGNIRITKIEYLKAKEYGDNYILSIVSNLNNTPKISLVSNPLNNLTFIKKNSINQQINYYSENLTW